MTKIQISLITATLLALVATTTDANALPPDPTNVFAECRSEANDVRYWQAACEAGTDDVYVAAGDLEACHAAAPVTQESCEDEFSELMSATAVMQMSCGQLGQAQGALESCIQNVNSQP